ncbi:MarR family winged helix-turn-helix transcriptional regulator [Acidipropionibacterium timonense]|uniref:MarR family winged helix-turn-helix transcriptional regulator n=1 Tax=Acidipropionibacterium timonense TaxID=2161818 RepID=UPI00102F3B51|nr:MarR family winged helix-turn-helix transcriptional regulator [Acidipropionibacterium timonense]
MAPSPERDEPDSTGELLARAFRSLRHRWMADSARFGLLPHQVRALRVLSKGSARPGQVADRLHITPRSATEVIDALVTQGLVSRAPDPTDRRATLVSLTDHGRQISADVLRERRRVSAEWLGRLGEEDRAELHRLLTLLLEDDADGHGTDR